MPTGDHYYTTDQTIHDEALNNGYVAEMTACFVFDRPTDGTEPLYMLVNPGTFDHFYTIDGAEAVNASGLGWDYGGIACYVFKAVLNIAPGGTAPAGTVPLFRLYNPDAGLHFYTTSVSERDAAKQSAGYTSDEGVACLVYDSQAAGTVPLLRLFKTSDANGYRTGIEILNFTGTELTTAAQRWEVPSGSPPIITESAGFTPSPNPVPVSFIGGPAPMGSGDMVALAVQESDQLGSIFRSGPMPNLPVGWPVNPEGMIDSIVFGQQPVGTIDYLQGLLNDNLLGRSVGGATVMAAVVLLGMPAAGSLPPGCPLPAAPPSGAGLVGLTLSGMWIVNGEPIGFTFEAFWVVSPTTDVTRVAVADVVDIAPAGSSWLTIASGSSGVAGAVAAMLNMFHAELDQIAVSAIALLARRGVAEFLPQKLTDEINTLTFRGHSPALASFPDGLVVSARGVNITPSGIGVFPAVASIGGLLRHIFLPSITLQPSTIDVGVTTTITVEAQDIVSQINVGVAQAPLPGCPVVVNGQVLGVTSTPFALTLSEGATGVVRVPGYPDVPIPWTLYQRRLAVTVTPSVLPFDVPVQLRVDAVDADNGTIVACDVFIDDVDTGVATGTTFTYTFQLQEVDLGYQPGSGTGRHPTLPTGFAAPSVQGYLQTRIPFRFSR